MKDISNVFFDTVSGVTNMRYLNAPKTRHEHQDEERAINHTLHDGGLHVDGDGSDL